MKLYTHIVYFILLLFSINSYSQSQNINVVGNGNTIPDSTPGPQAPLVSDDTDFGSVFIGNNTVHTITVQNTHSGGNPSSNVLTVSSISLSGPDAGEFSISSSITTIQRSNSDTFTITFTPTSNGTKSALVTIENNSAGADEQPYTFTIQGEGITPQPEINIVGNGNSITNGDITPSGNDDTDFGSVNESGGTNSNTFTIQNTGSATLNLTDISPYVSISGANASDFTLTAIPSNSINVGNTTTFTITFDPSALGLRTASVSIANDDNDENPYTFTIQGTGVDACGGYVTTFPYTESFETGIGLWQQDTGDNFDWTRHTGTTPTTSTGPNPTCDGVYYMYTEATNNLSSTANLVSPCIDLTGTTNPRFTFFYHMFGLNTGSMSVDLSTDGGMTYPENLKTITGYVQTSGNSSWIPLSFDLSDYIGQTIKIRIQGNTGGSDRSDISIDNISIEDKPNPTFGPGGITTDLSLWLKANDGLAYADGESVLTWEDQGIGSNVRPQIPDQAPTYRDNPFKNVNFNPVVEFDNVFSSFSLDSDYSHDRVNSQFLTGDYGYFTQEIFIVIIPDDTVVDNNFGFMDVICGDSHVDTNATDTTGIGFGDFTGRVSNEVICYAHDTYNTGQSPPDGYAVAQGGSASYDNVGIINTRNNTTNTLQELFYNAVDIETMQNDTEEFMNSSDTRFWIGRSEGWEATTNARIGEVVSYKTRKNDTDLTQERNRIQSYLALKWGITLGVNGTSQDYVNSDGTVIWDVNTGSPAEDVFNYDIAGIGRDDASELYQKQSRSVNNATDGTGRTQGVLTMGINQIYDTNNLNPNTLNDKEFLIWGNDGVNLDDPSVDVVVNMSSAIPGAPVTEVDFHGIARTWKVVERGGDIPSVEIAVLRSAIRTATPPDGRYLMFISDTPNFDPTADYRIMYEDVNELGEDIVKTNYDFDGTKYITFGWAPEKVYSRSVYFNGTTDYIDMENALNLNSSEFTVSAWIMRETGSEDKSILSKRDVAYSEGYDFKITATGKVEMSWKNGTTQAIASDVVIPVNQWHHVAVVFDGSIAKMYIDGVEDKQETLTPPASTTQSFFIGAAGKNAPTAFFQGNIDEVRVWERALTEAQLRYIMNQEIRDNSAFVGGKYFVARSVSPTKDDIATVPWNDLAGYYPMSRYTYTNTKDESGKGNQGALRNLRTVDRQTAPLPYVSNSNGDWDNSSTWENGNLQTKPGAVSLVDNTKTVDWNIVVTNHNVTMDNSSLPAANNGNRNLLALFVDSNKLTVQGNNTLKSGYGLTLTHYLKLDGKIDLEGESQLIQSLNSDLAVNSSGTLEKDQQGTRDLYTYNYWSSPVGVSNITTNNNSYALPNIFKDGTNAASPMSINFITSGYNGSAGTPIGIADYWIWKFANQLDDDYASWQHVRSTGTLNAGEGFTMKGVANTGGAVFLEQNYVLEGKPNNGEISLFIADGNNYLVGNPYPSALDAEQFILDNGPTIAGSGGLTGTLYFWEHWGGGSHILAEYQGGYATYNLSGGAPSASLGTSDPDVSTDGTPTKIPGRYIPVAQGFFVIAEASGNIEFNNNQRIFQKEGSASSVFVREAQTQPRTEETENTDMRMKLRIGFNSVNTIHRQLLVTVDERASADYEWGFDGKLNEEQMDDMYWMIGDEKFTIQGIDVINQNTVLPLGLHTNRNGMNNITIDKLENVPETLEIYLHDKALNIYHDLRASNYDIFLNAGTVLDRFEIVFSTNALGIDENELNTDLQVFYNNDEKSIMIVNPKSELIENVTMYNVLGQAIINETPTARETTAIKTQPLAAGTYLIKLKTKDGLVAKKVLVK
ncbi:MAG TPA: choice-of-anchor D domain-containing protein [Flavobacteriaceae bacterium]|nr:choice-of-anchor D domain-containing protein [Flavobacteriaceae bacterium]